MYRSIGDWSPAESLRPPSRSGGTRRTGARPSTRLERRRRSSPRCLAEITSTSTTAAFSSSSSSSGSSTSNGSVEMRRPLVGSSGSGSSPHVRWHRWRSASWQPAPVGPAPSTALSRRSHQMSLNVAASSSSEPRRLCRRGFACSVSSHMAHESNTTGKMDSPGRGRSCSSTRIHRSGPRRPQAAARFNFRAMRCRASAVKPVT